MKRSHLQALFVLGLAILCASAEARPPVALDPAREAAILPDAGFVARVDLAALGASTLVQSLFPLEENDLLARLASATGLGTEDLLDVVVSAKSDDVQVELELDDKGRRLSPVPGLMAISLARPLASGQLRAGMEAAWKGLRGVTSSSYAEVEIVEVAAKSSDEPAFYAATSRSGKVVFLSSDRPALLGALERERSGIFAPLPSSLEGLERSLSSGQQAHFVLRTPPALKDRLSTSGESAPTMLERMLEPFRGLQGLALGASLGEDARLELLGELGDTGAAERAEELLGSFLLPNLLRAVSLRLGGTELSGDAVTVTSDGSLARVSLRMSPEQVEALLAAREKRESEPSAR